MNNMDQPDGTSMFETVALKIADGDQTDKGLLECNPPFHVSELCLHLELLKYCLVI